MTLALKLLVASAVFAIGETDCAAPPSCKPEYSSTFELIQSAIFENRGCTSDLCHGSAKAGGLDLRASASYDALVGAASQTIPGRIRVIPGQTDESLLFINLAAKTQPGRWTAPLRAMPLDPVPALSEEELEAVRLWIQSGAPRDGVVAGTGDLLDACLPPPEPIEIEPLSPPPAGVGAQIRMAQWFLGAESEREVCFASYYDLSDQVPPEFRDPSGTQVRVNRTILRQDPLSHHLFGKLYGGPVSPHDPIWGPFHCRGGERDGQRCDPTDFAFCGTGVCSTTPMESVGCIGYGPADAQFGFNTFGITGTQETAVEHVLPNGVYAELPIKGMAIWSSHAFNLTCAEGKLEAWMNLYFASPEKQQHLVENIFDVSAIFKMEVAPFRTQEVCHVFYFPSRSHLYELTSHVHRRGKRFRAFLGEWQCDGGPFNGQACSPLGVDYVSLDLCQGAPCRSTRTIRVGDCNYDNRVTIEDLITGVNVALGSAHVRTCTRLDISGDGSASIDELIVAVATALTNEPRTIQRDPERSLLYLNYTYNDPRVEKFDPPITFPTGTVIDERAITYCALYDNGYTDPSEVKTRSGSPRAPGPFPIGGPCEVASHCTRGKPGAVCRGRTENERNVSCDSAPGVGDGLCDACVLRGGVTTEDEMFVLLGSYYVK